MTASNDQFTTHHIELAKPLLIIQAQSGFLACGYINPETCNKIGEACAIVSGVNSYDDMYAASVIKVSDKAREMGVAEGDTGQAALDKMHA